MDSDRDGLPASVLVVDDDEVTRMLAQQSLAMNGFEVSEAADGLQALEMIQDKRPDLVLLDVEMPNLDGFETATRIRELPYGADLPILMTTGHQDTESIDRAYAVGATDFATKPINWPLMCHRVRYLLRSSRAQEKIRELAYFDSLTTLPNRASFKDNLDRGIARVERHGGCLAVLFLDLDDFKRVNDTLGHSVGDMLLKSVADRLRSTVRTSDSLTRPSLDAGGAVARLGGDEFTILLTDLRHIEDAGAVARRVLQALSNSFELNGNVIYTTPSIGIATYPEDGDNSETLLKSADTAMYFAKRDGKNLYRFHDSEMNAEVQRRATLDSNLRQALDNNELSVHYQPQMDVSDRGFIAVEALIRWENAQLGSVPPLDFIPLAEENGLIIPIGEWVLRTACKQAKSWRDRGMALQRVAVNISVAQFVRSDFPAMVSGVLEETGLEPHALELEITESVLAKDAEGAVKTLKALKAIGVQLSIDDFGTGYSSLNQLKCFPIDRLKIDRSFVKDIISDPDDAAITNAVIRMAESMDLQVIAEGVETVEQLKFLERSGCHEIQGYFLSKPMAAEELESVMRANNHTREQPGSGDEDERTVLMVNGGSDSLSALSNGWSAQPVRILTARSADEGFSHLANHTVDVVVSDQAVQGMSANEFLERVGKLHPDTTRIMLAEQTSESVAPSDAVHKLLRKPLSLGKLEDELLAALRSRESRGAA